MLALHVLMAGLQILARKLPRGTCILGSPEGRQMQTGTHLMGPIRGMSWVLERATKLQKLCSKCTKMST